MEVEKRTSKGGFFNLFDWGVKSRKKLFSDNSTSKLPGLDEGNDNVEKLPTSRLQVIKVNDYEASSSTKGSNDYHYTSSVSSEESVRVRDAGVVAKLMGLDSLPTSRPYGPRSTPVTDSCSSKENHSDGIYTNLMRNDHRVVNYDIMQSKFDGFTRHLINPDPKEVKSRPIERFQTEILPKKTAKPISITHNKLLSPIKSPAYIPIKNKAYMMEVAAKIIEPSSQAIAESKRTSFVSSSVPLRIRDLRKKMEAANQSYSSQRHEESEGFKLTKEQFYNKKNISMKNKLDYTEKEKGGCENMNTKGKSLPLTAQAKGSVQRSSTRRSITKMESNEIKSNQIPNSRSNTQISGHKRASTSVLRQNNHKQNYIPNRDKVASKTNQQTKNLVPVNDSSMATKTTVKVVSKSQNGPRKMGEKDLSSSRTRTMPPKKESGNFEQSDSGNNAVLHGDGRSIQCNAVIDGCINRGAGKKIESMDVISFTFSSPIKSSKSRSQVYDTSKETKSSCGSDHHGQNDSKMKRTSQGLNVIGSDALSILLEQKLRELTSKIESPQFNLVKTGPDSTLSVHSCSVQDPDNMSTVSTETESEGIFSKDKLEGMYDSNGPSSSSDLVLKASQKCQDEHGSDSNEQLPCLEPILSNGSSSLDIRNNNGISNPGKESQPAEDKTGTSNSTSSTFTMDMDSKDTTPPLNFTDLTKPDDRKLQYIKDILNNVELTMENFALNHTHQVMTPNLFDQLEDSESFEEKNEDEYSKLERNVLFDCVRECLDSRYGNLSLRSCCKSWTKWEIQFRSKERLAEEIHKGILGIKSMEEMMVDDLVDKDMSTELGKWLDFRIEEFEEGIVIENEILLSLVDELVTDIYLA